MNTILWIAKKIFWSSKSDFSPIIVKIAFWGLCIGISVLIITNSIVNGYQEIVPKKLSVLWGDLQIRALSNENTLELNAIQLNSNSLDFCSKNENIISFYGIATKTCLAKTETDFEGVLLKGYDHSWKADIMTDYLTEGKVPRFSASDKSNDILIPQNFALKMKLKIGDYLPFYFLQNPPRVRSLKIIGIYKTGLEQEIGRPIIICDIKHIQTLNNWDSSFVGGYEVIAKSGTDLELLSQEIRNHLPMEVESFTIFENFPAMFSWLSLFNKNEQIVYVIMLVVALLNLISAMLIMILENVRKIGVLKSIGLTNSEVNKLFFYIGAFLLSFGMLAGNIVGISLSLLQSKFHLIHLPEENYYVPYVPIKIDYLEILQINAIFLLVGLLVLLLPGYIAKKLNPINALRFK